MSTDLTSFCYITQGRFVTIKFIVSGEKAAFDWLSQARLLIDRENIKDTYLLSGMAISGKLACC